MHARRGPAPDQRLGRPGGARPHAPRRPPDGRLPGRAAPRRCGRATSCSTSAPGAACSPSPRPGRAPGSVYAVEASDIAEVAERVFAANGVQDRVTLIPGWSQADRAARAGRPAGRGGHRQRAVRGGDPRDHARRPPPAAEARRAADPARARRCWRGRCCSRRPRPGSARSAARPSSAGDSCTASTSSRCSTPRSPGPVNTPDRGRGRRHVAAGRSAGRARHRRPRGVRGRHRCDAVRRPRRRRTGRGQRGRRHVPRRTCTGRSRTRSIPGRGRRRAGRRRCGCFPTRSGSGPPTRCACATTAGSGDGPTDSRARSSPLLGDAATAPDRHDSGSPVPVRSPEP